MEQLQVLNFEENTVRTINRDGEMWWVLKDVCDVLDISNSREVANRLDEDELMSVKLTSGGQEREMTIISESGLYSVILRSDKPKAKPFRKWVTSEVLPSIRKTGGYTLPGKGNRIDKLEETVNKLRFDFYHQSMPVSKDSKSPFGSTVMEQIANMCGL
jgi:prophage antirepressor-like protein